MLLSVLLSRRDETRKSPQLQTFDSSIVACLSYCRGRECDGEGAIAFGSVCGALFNRCRDNEGTEVGKGEGGIRMMCSSHAKAPSHKNNKLFVAAKRSPKKAKGAREKFKKRAPNLTRGRDVLRWVGKGERGGTGDCQCNAFQGKLTPPHNFNAPFALPSSAGAVNDVRYVRIIDF